MNETEFVELLPGQRWTMSKKNDTLSFIFVIKNGFHIQANQPMDENLIPTEFSISDLGSILTGEPKYPRPEKFNLKNDSSVMLVFHGRMKIEIPVKIKDNTISSHFLAGKLKYQACDSVKCYFPRELPFKIPLQTH